MPSPEASRRNASKSTGPRTREGKAAVRLNSLTHGAFATDLLLPGEPAKFFRALEAGFLRKYKPVTEDERFLVNRMIMAAWRVQRLAAMETRLLRAHVGMCAVNVEFAKSLRLFLSKPEDLPEPKPGSDDSAPEDPIAHAWLRDITTGNGMVKLSRAQTALERSFYRALHELERLRAPMSA